MSTRAGAIECDRQTPPGAYEETLVRAIESGRLDDGAAADADLLGALAAHRKLEALFALLRQPVWLDAQPEPAPETLGRYLIRGTLGSGTFGTVYLGDDPQLRRLVAIKSPRAGFFSSPSAAEKFLAEARCIASLKHPAIVAVYDVGRDADRSYIVMEHVAGRTLEELLNFQRLDFAKAAQLLAQVADALHYAHKLGFVHRDLKPANILLDAHGTPHIADFGLAINDETQRLFAGQIAGTPAYMSPEQARGASHHLDGRADIWSLGVIGYELLTGRQPFWQGDTAACLDAIQHRDPKPPRQIDDAIPAELERIILKCLGKQPTDRYSTAGDVAADLRRWSRAQSGGGTTARRAMIAGVLILATCLAVFGWRVTRGVPVAATQPLTGTIDVRLWNPGEPTRRGLTLGEPGALPLRIGDQVRIEALLSEPSYVYIVWIGADGVAHPVYPWLNGDWGNRGSEKPTAKLSLPDDPTLGWPMSGPAGTEMLLLLARRSPLDGATDLHDLVQGMPDIMIDVPQVPVQFGGGEVLRPGAESNARAPVFNAAQRIDDSALLVERFLKERFGGKFDLTRAVGFTVARHERE